MVVVGLLDQGAVLIQYGLDLHKALAQRLPDLHVDLLIQFIVAAFAPLLSCAQAALAAFVAVDAGSGGVVVHGRQLSPKPTVFKCGYSFIHDKQPLFGFIFPQILCVAF